MVRVEVLSVVGEGWIDAVVAEEVVGEEVVGKQDGEGEEQRSCGPNSPIPTSKLRAENGPACGGIRLNGSSFFIEKRADWMNVVIIGRRRKAGGGSSGDRRVKRGHERSGVPQRRLRRRTFSTAKWNWSAHWAGLIANYLQRPLSTSRRFLSISRFPSPLAKSLRKEVGIGPVRRIGWHVDRFALVTSQLF